LLLLAELPLLLSLLLLPLLFFSSPRPHSCIFAVLASEHWQGVGCKAPAALRAHARRAAEVDALVTSACFKNQSGTGACSDALLV
jgi:hypothetical protein